MFLKHNNNRSGSSLWYDVKEVEGRVMFSLCMQRRLKLNPQITILPDYPTDDVVLGDTFGYRL